MFDVILFFTTKEVDMKNLQNQKNLEEFPKTRCSHMLTLMQCLSVCTTCARKCIEEGHKESAKMCLECAEICALAIKSHSADFELDAQIMELCAKACERCSQICAKMEAKHCQECAEVCHQCSEACSESACQSNKA